jgi:hypothetical protein
MGTAAACFSNLWPTARMGDVSWVYRSLMPEVSPSHDIAHFTHCFSCRAGQEYRTVLRLRDLLQLHADYFQLITDFIRSRRSYLRSAANFREVAYHNTKNMRRNICQVADPSRTVLNARTRPEGEDYPIMSECFGPQILPEDAAGEHPQRKAKRNIQAAPIVNQIARHFGTRLSIDSKNFLDRPSNGCEKKTKLHPRLMPPAAQAGCAMPTD